MTPADIPVVWPTAHEIARAVFVAAGLEDQDPIDVLQGRGSARARAYALIALAHEFPTAPRATLSRKLGNDKCASGVRTGLKSKAWPWFSLDRLNAVRAACGWSDMTLEEAEAAPLLYLGRAWTEFLPPVASAPDSPGVGGAEAAVFEAEKAQDANISRRSSAEPNSPDERASTVERMKAWARGDAPEVVPPPVVKSPPISDLVAPAPAQPVVAPKPTPKPVTPSPAASALAGAAKAMQSAKAARKPAPSVPAPPPREIADTRRAVNDLAVLRAAEFSRGVTSFRPDPPAEQRGMVNITAELMGDPPASRSALAQRGQP